MNICKSKEAKVQGHTSFFFQKKQRSKLLWFDDDIYEVETRNKWKKRLIH